jgi:hypothetical protein
VVESFMTDLQRAIIDVVAVTHPNAGDVFCETAVTVTMEVVEVHASGLVMVNAVPICPWAGHGRHVSRTVVVRSFAVIVVPAR